VVNTLGKFDRKVDIVTQSFARAFGHGIRFLSVSAASVDTVCRCGRNRDKLQAKAEKTTFGRIVTPEDAASASLTASHISARGAHSVSDRLNATPDPSLTS
jgi:hypothetical protein